MFKIASRVFPMFFLICAAGFAQNPNQAVVISSDFVVEGKSVTGVPYSAQAVTSVTQTLSTGSQINNQVTSTVARDTDGRTRREMTVRSIGPWAVELRQGGESPLLVVIQDPVKGVTYTLDPQQRVAREQTMGGVKGWAAEGTRSPISPQTKALLEADVNRMVAEAKSRAEAAADTSSSGAEAKARVDADMNRLTAETKARIQKDMDRLSTALETQLDANLSELATEMNTRLKTDLSSMTPEEKAKLEADLKHIAEVAKAEAKRSLRQSLENSRKEENRESGRVSIEQGKVRFEPTREQKESLGNRVIDGIAAQGERTTRTISAGEIGNTATISVVSETWYSPELHVVILGKRSDPRVGDLTYQLKNIKRENPQSSLFEVPAGYTVRQVPNYEFQFRINELRRFEVNSERDQDNE